MKWLWYVGPIVGLLVYALVAFWPDRRQQRRKAELRRWVEEFLGPLPVGPKAKKARRSATTAMDQRAKPLPGKAQLALQALGIGGAPALLEYLGLGSGSYGSIGDVVLVPTLAYLTVHDADHASLSHHQTVIARLAKAAPRLVIRPRPMEGGGEDLGVPIDDPEFSDAFVVTGDDRRAIAKWLRPSIREALLELPEVWVQTDRRWVAITLFGEATAEQLDELVGVADAVFAERGAGGAPSLFGDDEAPAAKTRAEDDEEDAEEGTAEPALASLASRAGALGLDLVFYLGGLAILIAVLALRHQGLDGLRPSELFQPLSGDPLDGAWQGGWTTRGFGALVGAETILVGLFVLQTYLAARAGQTIGMRLLGARATRLDNGPVHFFRGVLLRTWLVAAIPIGVTVYLTRPFGIRSFIVNLLNLRTLWLILGAIALDALFVLLSSQRRTMHDLVAGTKVVEVPGGLRRLIG